MSPQKRVLLLIIIMSLLVVTTSLVTIGILYRTAINEEKIRLSETAKSQARLIESVARFNQVYCKDYPADNREATLNQIQDAHSKYVGFGVTGEFTLAERVDDKIVFLLNHRHYDMNNPKPVSWNSNVAEPMREALSGKSGSIIGFDYRGVKVIAAHEPVNVLNMGIVSKIDLTEIQAPFKRAAIITWLFSVLLIGIGAGVFFRITNPILDKLNKTITSLEKALKEVKTLRGIIPICSFCKKIRNDEGYWDLVEFYFEKHTDVDFSHSVCPNCMKEHYPEEYDKVFNKSK